MKGELNSSRENRIKKESEGNGLKWKQHKKEKENG